MLDEKKIDKKLKEILEMAKELRMDYFDTFPEDANEDRISWDELFNMATDDYSKLKKVKDEIEKLIDDIDCFEYDKE